MMGGTLVLPVDHFEPVLARLPHPLVFLTVSGSHLYGFPSQDSDWDLRGSHLLPGDAFWGLDEPVETLDPQAETAVGPVEAVSHDLRKFSRMLLKKNGYVLEQLTSPLVVRTSPVHQELLRLVPRLLTRNHYYHYRGFYRGERREYEGPKKGSVKRLLYCFRVLMTGCVLLREGVVEANIQELNRRFQYSFLDDLVEIKARAEGATVSNDTLYMTHLAALEEELDRAFAETALPETSPARAEVDRLLVEARRKGVGT